MKMVIDLAGYEGNAFYLLGLAKILAGKDPNLDGVAIQHEMLGCHTYEGLVKVFQKYFDSIVEFKNVPADLRLCPSSS